MADRDLVVQPELKALIDYAQTLSPPSPPGQKHRVPHHEWQRVVELTQTVVKKLEAASKELSKASKAADSDKSKRLSTLADRVVEVSFDAGDLQRRAKLARDRSETESAVLTREEEATLKTLKAQERLATTQAVANEKVASIAAAVAKAVDQDAAKQRVADLLEKLQQARTEATAAAIEADNDRLQRETKHDVAERAAAKKTTSAPPATQGAPSTSAPSAATSEDTKKDSEARAVEAAVARIDDLLERLDEQIQAALKDLPEKPKPVTLKTHRDEGEDLLQSCQGTLETVRDHLGDSSNLDDGAQAFLDRLDLLAELLLGLRRTLSEVPR